MVPLEVQLEAPHIDLLQGSKPYELIAEEQSKTMTAAVLVAKGEIIPLTPANTGITRKAMMTMIYGEDQSLVGRVFNPLGHALPLEGGAHWTNSGPPIGPLRLWAQRKFSVDEGEATHIAWGVRHELMKRGLFAKNFFKGGYILAKPKIEALWVKCLERITKRLAGQ